jgi:serine/threonine protein kinase
MLATLKEVTFTQNAGQRSGMKFSFARGARPLEGYTIQRGVGRGGFGEVYFAVSDAGKELALKRIERNLEIELRGVSQCLNLKHPHLVDLYDIRYDSQGGAWVVMEYMTGDSLAQVLSRHPQGLPHDEIFRWCRGLLAGLAYLHEQGLVHRDLKPGNLFDDAGTIKIGDYGLSKFIAHSKQSGHTESVGTLHYMAPEIGRGSYGKEIDIYALGVLLYEMITGHVPYDGESAQEIIMRHLTEDPPVAHLPPRFRHVVERALQKDPAHRFASVREMAQLLLPPVEANPLLPSAVVRADVVPSDVMRTEPVAGNDKSVDVVPVALAVAKAGKSAKTAAPTTAPRGAYPPRDKARSATTNVSPTGGLRIRSWHEMLRDRLRGKTPHERLQELVSSWLAAGFVAALLGVLLLLLNDQFETNQQSITLYAWITLSAATTSGAILAVGKWCEGVESDGARRRLVMLALGLMCGACVFGLAQWLLLDLQVRNPRGSLPHTMYAADGTLKLPLFMIYFALLLALPRWWKQTDPLRRARVQLWPVIACVLLGWLLGCLWPLPQPAGSMLIAVVSLTTQLAATWITTAEREQARQEYRRL